MDVKTSTLETRTVTVYQLLTEVEKLTIPQYQRPYKWTSRHVGQLFSDIAAFRHKNAYRLGTVVFHHDNDSHTHNIVDGQQRTITLMLAVHALIYNREKTSDGPRRKDLDKQLGELKAKMPDPCFENNISKRNIHANYLQISRIVRRDDFDEDQIHFLLNRCNFVTFALKDISEAFQFFDSQNARGKDLEPHDLLKAFHLRELSNHENDLKSETVSRWENSETAELSALFAQYLYRIRNWTRGESARYFGKEDTDLFKGVNIDTASDFPYIEQLRLAHHFVEQYNNAYERKVDGNKMQFPFHIDQIIINGRRFFEMTNHYLSRVNEATGHDEYKTFLDDNAMIGNTKEILDTINTYEGRNRTGDMYVRMMFDCMLIYYIDKFGVIELPRAIENIFIWAYSLRLQMQVVQLASMDNHVPENNLFKRLKDATDPREFLDISLPAVTENRSKKQKTLKGCLKGWDTMTERIEQLTVGRLLGGDAHYRIPIYQRNYAWDEGEITQLIQDVIDYTKRDQNYYIGTLVVFKVVKERADKEVYETIDGQQRLTTLSLLASYLKNEKEKEETDVFWCRKLSLEFECRENSRRTLSKIFEGNTESLAPDETNSALLNGYQIIRKILPQRLSEHNVSEKDFAGYLFERVHIMRVTLPQDTEDYLNHYFEIMNNRGEQLEKHEVLKSRLLEILNRIPDPEEKAENKECMHRIWEACSNMEKYAQSGFSPEERHNLFGNNDWGELKAKDFNAVKNSLSYGGPKEARTEKLTEIISHPQPPNARTSDDPNAADVDQERFNSVTNFPNFLLHVLRVSTGKDLPLDDKRLIDIFEDEIIKKDSPDEVKKFGFDLLKCKYIYDRFIIKREFSQGKDRWRLQRYKRSDGGQKAYYTNTFGEGDGQDDINRRILMLLAAFHVSTPTQVYKHWLNAALHWLYNAESITAESYCTHLENVAKAFVFDRYLGGHPNAEYYEIIYGRNGLCKSTSSSLPDDKLRERLSFGNIKNNLVFNYLDYILWLKHKDSDQIGKIISTYEFTFRSSVEHYYPQHPLPGHPPLQQETLNSFGNLCLISHGKNSRLSNFMPQAKKEYYQKNPIDSVKQYLMMQEASWDASSIQNHYDEMVKVLREQLIVAPDF